MPHTTVRPWRPWTDAEITTLRELAAEGLPLVAIGHQMRSRHGRTSKATTQRIARLGGLDVLRGGRAFRWHSLSQVCRLMGEPALTVRIWIDRGWLIATRSRRRRTTEQRSGPMYLISDTSLHAFLAIDAAWPSYAPGRMADPDLRAEAERLRAAAGGGWVRLSDLMRQLCYCPRSDMRMLAAYPGPTRVLRWHAAAYLWQPHVPAFVAWVQDPRNRRAA